MKDSVQLNYSMYKSSLTAFIMALLLAACAYADSLSPFTTDGCSLFIDRLPFGDADWCHCCVVHDLAYWRGGPKKARLNADKELKTCVQKASGSTFLANVMFAGVRMGGSPYLPTWFRWGYGWPFGRSYGPLTPEEETLASSLEREYRTKNPMLTCPSPMPVSE